MSAARYEIAIDGCPFRKSYPDVMVMQSGEDEDGNNDTRSLNSPPQRRILAQHQVWADFVVVRRVGGQNPT
jgi:hypothetical protein